MYIEGTTEREDMNRRKGGNESIVKEQQRGEEREGSVGILKEHQRERH